MEFEDYYEELINGVPKAFKRFIADFEKLIISRIKTVLIFALYLEYIDDCYHDYLLIIRSLIKKYFDPQKGSIEGFIKMTSFQHALKCKRKINQYKNLANKLKEQRNNYSKMDNDKKEIIRDIILNDFKADRDVQVVALRYYREMAFEEIAIIIDRSIPSVKRRLAKGLNKLNKAANKKYPDYFKGV